MPNRLMRLNVQFGTHATRWGCPVLRLTALKAPRGLRRPVSLASTRLSYRFDDRLLQQFCRKWFLQERDRACHRDLGPDILIVMPAHENDWILESVRRELMCQLHPSAVAEVKINHQAGRFARGGSLEECRG